MLLAGWEVRIGKNCDLELGLENAVLGRPKPANNVLIFFFLRQIGL